MMSTFLSGMVNFGRATVKSHEESAATSSGRLKEKRAAAPAAGRRSFSVFSHPVYKNDEVYGIADLGTVVQPEAEQQDIIVHKDIGHAESHAGHLVPDIGQQLRPP